MKEALTLTAKWGIQPDCGKSNLCNKCAFQNPTPKKGIFCNAIRALTLSSGGWLPADQVEQNSRSEVAEPNLSRWVGVGSDRKGLVIICSGYRRKWWRLWDNKPFTYYVPGGDGH